MENFLGLRFANTKISLLLVVMHSKLSMKSHIYITAKFVISFVAICERFMKPNSWSEIIICTDKEAGTNPMTSRIPFHRKFSVDEEVATKPMT